MNYYGMTVGPIVETISATSKPAGLWMASYFFSTVTRDLCARFSEEPGVTIVSPYFSKEDGGKRDGIGRYNDRIILQVEEDGDFSFEEKLQGIIEDVKTEKGKTIAACNDMAPQDEIVEYIKKYVYVQYICISESGIENNNVLASVSSKLDALELMQPTPAQFDRQYLQEILVDNKKIKEYDEFSGAERFLTSDDGQVKDILDIAECRERHSDLKFRNYFAIVYADGDHMGTVVKRLAKDDLKQSIDAQRDFSKKCLDYTAGSAELIARFGGAPVYAGGDDLLFMAPLVGKEGKSVFQLCDEISTQFNDIFRKERNELKENGPSLSFGISINYHKFPLYEAVDDARRLLFAEAKGGGQKRIYNSLAVRLRKASGQSEEFVLKQGGALETKLESLLANRFLNPAKHTEDEIKKAHGTIFTIERFSPFIDQLWDESQTQITETNRKDVFGNFFDNVHQTSAVDWIKDVLALGDAADVDLKAGSLRIREESGGASVSGTISAMLRLCKFFVEKKGEED